MLTTRKLSSQFAIDMIRCLKDSNHKLSGKQLQPLLQYMKEMRQIRQEKICTCVVRMFDTNFINTAKEFNIAYSVFFLSKMLYM